MEFIITTFPFRDTVSDGTYREIAATMLSIRVMYRGGLYGWSAMSPTDYVIIHKNEVSMNGATPPTTNASETVSREISERGRKALIQVIVLIVLCLIAFREESIKTLHQSLSMVQSSYALAIPLLIALMIVARRRQLLDALRAGSVWGIVVLLLAIAAYAVTTWPFYFGYARKLTLLIALVGIVLAVCGWRVLWRCMPMLLLAFLAMPLGWYTFASLINRPERMMVRGTAMVLRALPETQVKIEHDDLHYIHGDNEGTIGLGDFHFGFAAPVAFLSAILFAIFVRVRPIWQVFILLALALPLVALGNFLKLIAHGLLTIYLSSGPTSGFPRDASMIFALVVTYLAICISIGIMNNLVGDLHAETEDDEAEQRLGDATDA